jgi:PAS domain S-box-containing protein
MSQTGREPDLAPSEPIHLKWRQWAMPAMVLGVGIAISLVLFQTVLNWHHRETQATFARIAADRFEAIRKDTEADEFVLQALASFYDGSNSVEREEFTEFVAPSLAWQPDIRSLAWVPRVRAAELDLLQETVRKEGVADFHMTEATAAGRAPLTRDRAEYYPVLFAEPRDRNAAVFGVDLYSEPARREAMDRACDSGRLAATAQVRLLQRDLDVGGFLLFMPVYRRGAPTKTVEDRRASLQGFVAEVLETKGFIDETLVPLSAVGTDIHLFDLSSPPGRQYAYSYWSRTREGVVPDRVPDPLVATSELRDSTILNVAGRQWLIVCEAAPAFDGSAWHWEAWATLIVGLGITLLLAGYVVVIKRHAVRAENLATAVMAGNRLLAEQIVKRREVERTARREAAKLTAMISGMEEGVVFADAEGTLVEANDYFCRFVRQPRDRIVGRNIEEFRSRPIWEGVLSKVDRFRTQAGSSPLVIQRTVGTAEVILRVQPIYRDGQYDGVLLNVIDVTELVTARHQAEEASRAKGAFLANMSHEIRTPMTAILGFAELIDNSIECCTTCSDHSVCQTRLKNKESIQIIRRNGEHLLELINDILDLSKIEAGKLVVEIAPCSVPSVIADVNSMMRVRADQRGISLVAEYATEMPETIWTDSARVRQALLNLVGNAIKFTEHGGVRIVTSFIPGLSGAESAVRIDVIDSGIGISEEKLAPLFQPFSQADASTSRKYGGTGLGLAITRNIAQLLKGSVTVKSVEGQGTTFTLLIPTGNIDGTPMVQCHGEALRDLRDHPGSAAARLPSLAGLRILLAEDGEDNQRLICTLLTKAGAVVETADNGRLAVEKAQAGSFDVVLMDMQMPEMDGHEATRLLRSRGYTRPILALTAHAMASDRRLCLDAGCNDHLSKPIDRARLITTVAAYAGRAEKTPEVTPSPSPAAAPTPWILQSTYADDPDVAPILVDFLEGLPAHVERLRLALGASAWEELQRQAHQIKGAGGSYGYALLSEAAHTLEDAAKARDPESAALALRRVAGIHEAIARGAAGEPAPKEVRQ